MSFNILCLFVSLIWLPFSAWLVSHFPLFPSTGGGILSAIVFVLLPLIFIAAYGVWYEWAGEEEEKHEMLRQLARTKTRLDRVNYSVVSGARSVILARLLTGNLQSLSRLGAVGAKLENIIDNIFETLSRNLGVSKASLWLISHESGVRKLSYSFGWSTDEISSAGSEEFDNYGAEKNLAFPLVLYGKRLGTLQIDCANDEKLLSTGEEKQLIEVLTYLLAVHIELSTTHSDKVVSQDDSDGIGVYSYAHMMRLLRRESSRAVRYGEIYTILLVQVSRFASLCELHGETPCQELCDSLALLLSSLVREMDVVGRYGDGAFLVMLPQTHRVGGVNLASRIEKCAEKRLSINNSDLLIDVVVSVATFPEDGSDELKLISGVSDDWRYSGRAEE